MRIDIITSVPELLTSPLNESILKRAQDKGLVEIVVHNLHDYAPTAARPPTTIRSAARREWL